jgi:hypothetical protein
MIAMVVYVHPALDEVLVENERVVLININPKIRLTLYGNEPLEIDLFIFSSNRISKVFPHLLFYVKQHQQMLQISSLINLFIVPYLIMINKSVQRFKSIEKRFDNCQWYDWYWWTIKIVRNIYESIIFVVLIAAFCLLLVRYKIE